MAHVCRLGGVEKDACLEAGDCGGRGELDGEFGGELIPSSLARTSENFRTSAGSLGTMRGLSAAGLAASSGSAMLLFLPRSFSICWVTSRLGDGSVYHRGKPLLEKSKLKIQDNR